MKTMPKLSPTQQDCLNAARKHSGRLTRYPGGFWSAHRVARDPKSKVPTWYFSTATVRALMAKGLFHASRMDLRSQSPLPLEVSLTPKAADTSHKEESLMPSTSDGKTVNLTNKPLAEFAPGDTLYIQKKVGGFSYQVLCRFEKIERGIVQAEVIQEVDEGRGPASQFSPGDKITARSNACCLWGKRTSDPTSWPRWHWFYNSKLPAGINSREAAKTLSMPDKDIESTGKEPGPRSF